MGLSTAYGIDVTTSNYREQVFIKGDDFANQEALRLIPHTIDIHNGKHIEFQRKTTSGVWRRTGIDLSGDPELNLGNNFALGAAGNHLRSWDEGQDHHHTYNHKHFDVNNGSTETHDDPVLGALITRSIRQPDDSGQMAGTQITWTVQIPIGEEAFLTKIYLNVGSIPATDNAHLIVKRDDVNGTLFVDMTISKATLSGGEFPCPFPGWIEDFGGTPLYFELTFDNGGNGSLLSNVGNTIPWQAMDYYPEQHYHLAPMEIMYDNFVIDKITNQHMLTTDAKMFYFKPNFSQQGIT